MEDDYLRSVSKGMIESIKKYDPKGVWLAQTWALIDGRIWTKEKIAAYLSGVEGPDDLILLDLFSDAQPLYDKAGENKKKVRDLFKI